MSGWNLIIVLVIIAIVVIVILARLYRKASREVSLIRTGLGGQKIIMAGGAIALPYFHEIAEINMGTSRLEIRRSGEDSLITRDRLRVDIGASFSLAVEADPQAIARAAQTLGDRSFNAERLRDIVEGRLVDALRAVAARMTLDEIHEGRAEFSDQVRELIKDDLSEIGLRLQSVSLTALDQTPFDALDENNAFNAVGMRKLAEVIATARKERAQIDADADVAVRLSSMEATKRKLEIDQNEEQARIDQEKQIELMRAAQAAEIAHKRAESERDAESAQINKEHDVRAMQIERERETKIAEIKRDLAMEAEQIAKERDLQLEQQLRQIAIANKTEEESRAQAQADSARAEAAAATESIATSRLVAQAERERQVAVLEAQKSAEAEAVQLTTRAEAEAKRLGTLAGAEREAAEDQAKARLTLAKSDAESERERAEAKRAGLMAEAEGHRALVDAENELSEHIVSMKQELARLETLPKALAEMVRPAEKIDSIKIHHVTGLGNSGSGIAAEGGFVKTPINQALDSILDMAVQMPALKKLGDQIGISMDDSLLEARGEKTDNTPEPADDQDS